jgi:phenylacetate-CoA ligase
MSEKSKLPIYQESIDWGALFARYPVPDIFESSVYRSSREQIREFQNERFLEVVTAGWRNEFYRERWRNHGLDPGDIRDISDSHKIPTFTSDDIKKDQQAFPPFGSIHGPESAFHHLPIKLQTSGGTTGKPRPTLFGPQEWEVNALTVARGMYITGARPGDTIQIPATCSLANLGWITYKACHDYLGILPLTTGSGVVTPSRRQLELAFEWGTNIWMSFPEYLTQLAHVAREELGRDVRELNTKFIASYLGPDLDGSLRKQLEEQWGCPVYDNYGAHEFGLAAFECQEKSGLHLMEDCVYCEFVDVDTGKPVPAGTAGNLVITVFHRSLPPIVRFNVRDLARLVTDSRCNCGSCFRRMDHFLGRSDDMIKLRGVNVYPMACLSAVRSDTRTTGEWFCVVDRFIRGGVIRDEMTVKVELRSDATAVDDLKTLLERRLHNDLGVKVAVELVRPGELNDVANLRREGKPRRLLDRRATPALNEVGK